jgi:hypothetical protein
MMPGLKRLVKARLGFFSPETAWNALQGYEQGVSPLHNLRIYYETSCERALEMLAKLLLYRKIYFCFIEIVVEIISMINIFLFHRNSS